MNLLCSPYNRCMPKFEKHIFVCTNQREPGHPRGCCDPEGKAEMQGILKQKLAVRGLKGKVHRIAHYWQQASAETGASR